MRRNEYLTLLVSTSPKENRRFNANVANMQFGWFLSQRLQNKYLIKEVCNGKMAKNEGWNFFISLQTELMNLFGVRSYVRYVLLWQLSFI